MVGAEESADGKKWGSGDNNIGDNENKAHTGVCVEDGGRSNDIERKCKNKLKGTSDKAERDGTGAIFGAFGMVNETFCKAAWERELGRFFRARAKIEEESGDGLYEEDSTHNPKENGTEWAVSSDEESYNNVGNKKN